MESNAREWTGSSLDLRGDLDPNGIREVVIEFDGGDFDSFTPKMRDEFRSYELHQMSGYMDSIRGDITKNQGG